MGRYNYSINFNVVFCIISSLKKLFIHYKFSNVLERVSSSRHFKANTMQFDIS